MRKAVMALTALAAMAAAPALAAEDRLRFGSESVRTAAFAGVTFRLSLDGERRTPPVARLRLGMTRYDGALRMVPDRAGGALELGVSRKGRPDLYFGGERLADFSQRLGIAPAAAAAAAVAAIAVGAVAVSEISEDDRYQCFLPEKELCGDPDGG